jgi:hypothetical protein
MTPTTTRLVPAAIVLAVALTGCTPTSFPDISVTMPPTATGTPAAATTPAPTAAVEVPEAEASALPIPEAGPDSQATALDAAARVMTVFAQPNLTQQAWMDQMTPLLSPAGYEAYLGTDPARIPVTQVIGAGRILTASTEVSLIVEIPTDVGLYAVSLTRTGIDAVWLADRIRPGQG